MRKISNLAISLVCVGLVALFVSRFLRSQFSAGASSAPTGYTVTLRQLVHGKSGDDVIPNAFTTIAVRRDGSRAMVFDRRHANGSNEQTRNLELSTGGRFTIGDLWNVKTSWKRPAVNTSSWHRDPSRQCTVSLAGTPIRSSSETAVGMEIVEGYRTMKIASGTGNFEWFALDHGCALLRARYNFSDSVNEQQLVSFQPGEPDSRFFELAPTLKEVPPSEFMRTAAERTGRACDGGCLLSAENDDRKYHAQR